MLLLHFSGQDFGGLAAKRQDWSESHSSCEGTCACEQTVTPTPTQTSKCHQTALLTVWTTWCTLTLLSLSSILHPALLQSAVIQLLEEICHIVPSAYRAQCESIIGKFSKTVLDAILSYATPQAICALIHLCKGQEAPIVGQFTQVPLLQKIVIDGPHIPMLHLQMTCNSTGVTDNMINGSTCGLRQSEVGTSKMFTWLIIFNL